MTEGKAKRKPVDWESVEREYRAGVRSLKDIGTEYGVSAPAIVQRGKKYGWVRDLSAKIKQAAEDKVNAKLLNAEVNAERLVNERQIVDVNATMLADKVINQREDVRRARSIVNKLWAQVEAEVDHSDAFEQLGVMMRSPDEFGQDKLNDMYMAAISLPQMVKSVKLLADSIKVLIELERRILRIDNMPDPDPDAARKAGAEAGRAVASGIDAAMKELADKIAAKSE